jgi:chloramphenicol-sensitive protein RarD
MTSASATSSRAGPGRSAEGLVSGTQDRAAFWAGLTCYAFWGLLSLLFMALGRAGAGAWEITAERCVWSLPWAVGLVWLAGRQGEALAVLRRPRTLLWLACSAALVAANWSIFIYASTSGRKMEASLGYYINPLLNMAAGAALFRERFTRSGAIAIALASLGVLLQGVAVGHPPWLALGMAATFAAYGIIRKRVAASAQTGLLVECLVLAPFGLAYVLWLAAHGSGRLGAGAGVTALILLVGPATVIPLSLFAFATRRLPLSTMGFLQFVMPTIMFAVAMATGESLTPLRALSFAFIWSGVAVFSLWPLLARLRSQPVSG